MPESILPAPPLLSQKRVVFREAIRGLPFVHQESSSPPCGQQGHPGKILLLTTRAEVREFLNRGLDGKPGTSLSLALPFWLDHSIQMHRCAERAGLWLGNLSSALLGVNHVLCGGHDNEALESLAWAIGLLAHGAWGGGEAAAPLG